MDGAEKNFDLAIIQKMGIAWNNLGKGYGWRGNVVVLQNRSDKAPMAL